jgi:hypothetical protein
MCFGAGMAQAHDWYEGLRDRAGQSCCNGRDCRPVGLCVDQGQHEGLLIDGTCYPIPASKVLPLSSPDGSAHACYIEVPSLHGRKVPFFHCVILPGSS